MRNKLMVIWLLAYWPCKSLDLLILELANYNVTLGWANEWVSVGLYAAVAWVLYEKKS